MLDLSTAVPVHLATLPMWNLDSHYLFFLQYIISRKEDLQSSMDSQQNPKSPLWNVIVVIMVITPVNMSDSTEGEGDECQCRCIILGSSYSSGRLKRLADSNKIHAHWLCVIGFCFQCSHALTHC